MEGIYRLAWLRENSGLFQVNWRDMETEELGSVYESLLELTPRLTNDGHALGFAEGGETKGHARKTTGSYYTPDALVQTLLDSALDPVLDHAEAEADDPAQALLGVTVIDPACGSGHFLLAAARRIATRLAKARAGGVASASDFRHALRDVVRSCIHGVDRNPMAVELTKVALWIETVEPGKPLGFLDSSIRCGDSLLGIYNLDMLGKGIPDAAYKPLTGDDKEAAKYFEKQNKAEREGQGSLDFREGGGQLPPISPLVAEARVLRSLSEDSPEEIATKRARFQASRSSPRQRALRVAADLYVAAFLTPKTSDILGKRDGSNISTTAHVWKAAAAQLLDGPLVDRAQKLADAAHAFHWPLEFPDLMTSGGFDVVLGNPPWDRIKFQEQEFFASRHPEISEAPNTALRGRMILALKQANPGTREHIVFEEFEITKRIAEASSLFVRITLKNGGRFPLTGCGDVNTYALFAELAAALPSHRGRAGIIVPTGIATDETTADFFGSLLHNQQLISLYDFQTGKGFFDRIGHARFKFCLLTIGKAGTARSAPEFSFFSRTMEDFSDRKRFFRLGIDQIKRISPNTTTVPIFRSADDAQLTAKIYAKVPVLIEQEKGAPGNPWNLRLRRMFDKSNASEAGDLRAASDFEGSNDETDDDWLPVHERDYGHQFDHRFATFNGRTTRLVSILEHQDPLFEPQFELRAGISAYRRFLARWGVVHDHRSLLGFRRVSNSTNDRTTIAAILPFMPMTYGWILMLNPQPREQALLCANFNSLVFDYCLRNSLNQPSIPQGVFQQTPVLTPSFYSQTDIGFVVPRVLELTYTSYSLKPFAEGLEYGGAPFAWDDDRRALLRAELDAWYARRYGITRDELRYILDPADVMGPDHPSETFRVLKKNEIARFGEYRTARLVLAAWDRMERGEIRDVSPAIAIGETASAQISIDVSTLPDGAWANPTPSANASLAQIAALIKALPGPTPITHVRLAALLGMRAIVEDSGAHTWAGGPGLDQFVIDEAAWPYGRATFVLQALSKINLDEAVADLSHDDQAWVRASAA
jgi:Eco57I restriction-modification methylase